MKDAQLQQRAGAAHRERAVRAIVSSSSFPNRARPTEKSRIPMLALAKGTAPRGCRQSRTRPPSECPRCSSKGGRGGTQVSPLFWTRTLARLDRAALERDLGPIAMPDAPLDTAAAAQQATAD